ncbi:hypothetical protein IAD21_04071 [Abditibacteriota bacterium]|nr:hypothetical protein IAD21_04071 [Abditibacteriota bacterium]
MAYTDYRHTNRDDWEFTYTGAQLLEAARRKYTSFVTQEREARSKMAGLMIDMAVAQSDPRISECKKDIEKFGSERERCTVWIHEFARTPEQNYRLQIGDVAYFDLAPEPKTASD